MIGWVYVPVSETPAGLLPRFECARCGAPAPLSWVIEDRLGCGFCRLYSDRQAAKMRRARR